jgi:UDP-N-acetylglucosamine 2-epimerase
VEKGTAKTRRLYSINPFGDGEASKRIVEILLEAI